MNKLHNDCIEASKLSDALLTKLNATDTLLDAYLYTSRVKCGKPSCKCMTSDYRHESECLSFTENGSSRTRSVQEEVIDELGTFTSDYKELRKIRKQLVTQHNKLLKSFDSEVNSRLKRGRKRLSQLLSKKDLNNG
jgi:hypothetical protein